jgi:pimeloyl-ACP methyl ester carboxylesterase
MDETILMIHGMWGGAWVWDNYRRVLERDYRCVATTLRHHDMDPAKAPDPRLGTTSLLDYAHDLEQEIRKLGTKPILMGHSMGGLLAQILASRGLAKAVVLLTPVPPSGNAMLLKPSVLKSLWSAQSKWNAWKAPMRQTFAEAVYAMLELLPRDERKEIYDRFVYESGRAAAEIAYWFLDARGAARVDESKVACPVLVVGAAQDRIVPVSVVRPLARKYRAVCDYQEFENHGHWVLGEPGWEEVAARVADWLKRVLPRAG